MVKSKNDMRGLKQFMIGVSINQGAQTLTLFEGRKSIFDTLFKAHTSNKGPFKSLC